MIKYLTLIIFIMITGCSAIKLETIKARPIYKSNTIVTDNYKELTSALLDNIDGGLIILTYKYEGIQ